MLGRLKQLMDQGLQLTDLFRLERISWDHLSPTPLRKKGQLEQVVQGEDESLMFLFFWSGDLQQMASIHDSVTHVGKFANPYP